MKILSKIHELPFIKASFLFSPQWDCLAWSFDKAFQEEPYFQKLIAFFTDPGQLSPFFESFGSANEVEWIYQRGKLFFRKAGGNLLAVVMEKEASTEMVRLASDIAMPQLEKETKNFTSLMRDKFLRSNRP